MNKADDGFFYNQIKTSQWLTFDSSLNVYKQHHDIILISKYLEMVSVKTYWLLKTSVGCSNMFNKIQAAFISR